MGTVCYDGGANLFFDTFSGGTLFDDGLSLQFVSGFLAADFSSSSLNVFELSSLIFRSETVIDDMLGFDIDATGNDQLSVLWDLTAPRAAGTTDYGIMTFTGEFGVVDETDFAAKLNNRGLFATGRLSIIGESQDSTPVIPLPASAFLLLAGLGAFASEERVVVNEVVSRIWWKFLAASSDHCDLGLITPRGQG